MSKFKFFMLWGAFMALSFILGMDVTTRMLAKKISEHTASKSYRITNAAYEGPGKMQITMEHWHRAPIVNDSAVDAEEKALEKKIKAGELPPIHEQIQAKVSVTFDKATETVTDMWYGFWGFPEKRVQ